MEFCDWSFKKTGKVEGKVKSMKINGYGNLQKAYIAYGERIYFQDR